MNDLSPTQLALYLGAPCYIYSELTERWRRDIIDIEAIRSHISEKSYSYSRIVPALRLLSTMTPQELADLFNNGGQFADAEEKIKDLSSSLYELHELISLMGDFDTIQKLLQMGFDIFFWISEGYALDSSKKYDQWLREKKQS